MKLTPKQIAIRILLRDLEILTGYYIERDHDEYDKESETKKKKIDRQVAIFHQRIFKLLSKSKKET